MAPQTFQSKTHNKSGNTESRHLKQIRRINFALNLHVKIVMVMALGLFFAVHIVLYLSTTAAKIKYKNGLRKSKNSMSKGPGVSLHKPDTENVEIFRESKNSSSEEPGVLYVLHKPGTDNLEETFRKSKNISALVRSRKPNVLQILDKHVYTENIEKLRKTLASMKMTSKMFFHPTKTNTISQTGQIPVHDSCAVIGSSGILKGSSCGQEIDAHDFVIRENMAPVKGFEADVGARTSLMTTNDAMTRILVSCFINPLKSCPKKYTEIFKGFGKMYFAIPVYQDRPKHDQNQYDKFFNIAKFVNSDIDFRIPLHKFRDKLERYWKLPKMASGGFVNVNIAFTFCKRISIYGFFPFSRDLHNQKLEYHYYDKRHMKGGLGVHSMPMEYKIFKELHNNHTIRHVTKRCI